MELKDFGTKSKGIKGFFTNSPIGIFGIFIAAIIFLVFMGAIFGFFE
jgi:hypothetical protein